MTEDKSVAYATVTQIRNVYLRKRITNRTGIKPGDKVKLTFDDEKVVITKAEQDA